MMRIIRVVGIALVAAKWVEATEQITREEIIEQMVSGLKFSVFAGTLTPEQQAAAREAVVAYARSVTFLPGVITGLPDGTRRGLSRNRLTLIDADPAHCRLLAQEHLMSTVLAAEAAKMAPIPDAAQRQRTLEVVDQALAAVVTAIVNVAAPYITREEAQGWAQDLRATIEEHMADPTSEWGKRPLTAARAQELVSEFDRRLAENGSRIADRAARFLPSQDDPAYAKKLDMFKASLRGEIMQPMRSALLGATALRPDPGTMKELVKRIYPDYEEVQARCRKLRDAAWRADAEEGKAKTMAEQAAAMKAFEERMRRASEDALRRGRGRPVSGAAAGVEPSVGPPKEPLRERLVELPTSRPATQPDAK